ncbi:MAG TPA: Rap1a/Tai family immunity protein [Burkholderiales bacterium]
MTRLLPLLLLMLPLATSASPLAPIGRESGEELLARCEPALQIIETGSDAGLSPEQREAAISCIAFVDGFIWGHAWSAWREQTDMFYCPPEGFSARQGVPALVKYLRVEQYRRIQRAHLLVFAAFNRAYPCVALPASP